MLPIGTMCQNTWAFSGHFTFRPSEVIWLQLISPWWHFVLPCYHWTLQGNKNLCPILNSKCSFNTCNMNRSNFYICRMIISLVSQVLFLFIFQLRAEKKSQNNLPQMVLPSVASTEMLTVSWDITNIITGMITKSFL